MPPKFTPLPLASSGAEEDLGKLNTSAVTILSLILTDNSTKVRMFLSGHEQRKEMVRKL